MSWLWGALLPHAPVLVPDVGGGREAEAAATLRGLATLVHRIMHTESGKPLIPEYILLLSPHQPYAPGKLHVNTAPVLTGSLAPFGAAHIAVSLQTPGEALDRLVGFLEKHDIPVFKSDMPDITRDHGSLVPLYFLRRDGMSLPPVIIASPSGLSPKAAVAFGQALAKFDDGHTWALCASGDLSHRLTPEAPGGYNPAGKVFDKVLVESLTAGSSERLVSLAGSVVAGAGECGLRSVLTLINLCGKQLDVLSYEGPFGVGYCTALSILEHTGAQAKPVVRLKTPVRKVVRVNEDKTDSFLPKLARKSIEARLAGQDNPALPTENAEDASLLASKRACFVSIKTASGALRGCIGTIVPARDSLKDEIIANAIAAANNDPRFPPMQAQEVETAKISVDVLHEPEPIRSLSELHPRQYGVIVSKGRQRGLLLPNLDGVETVGQQLSIAARKGGIQSLEGATILRFRVDRYLE